MTSSANYKISLSGDVVIKDRPISEDLARQIINLVMGGASGGAVGGLHESSAGAALPVTQMANGNAPTPKVFMAQKKPASEVERMTCLAYYLAKYRDIHAFKTKEISKINTEAAQPPFSNAAVFARNATQARYLAKAGGGAKQITIIGEAVVEALPDREKVKAAIESNRAPTKKPRKSKNKKTK